MRPLKDVEELVSMAFGLWTNALFSNILGYNPEISFEEQTEAFFMLLEDLLNSGQVKFCTPNHLWQPGNDIWDAEAEDIISYLKSEWPSNAHSESDLNDYFYKIPAIVWVADDGSLHGS